VGRRIIYRIEDAYGNRFSEEEWQEVERLQHWYNSEFGWSTGRLALKRYVIFHNNEDFHDLHSPLPQIIKNRRASLQAQGLSEKDLIAQMERDRLIVVKWGGYYDNCLASGFTRVADNEWNAYLVCDFLLKASTLLPESAIHVFDEGKFIKTSSVEMRNASVRIPDRERGQATQNEQEGEAPKIFSIVDAGKYERHPSFRNCIPEFNKLKASERRKLVKNWNWLGYDGNFDDHGDDATGFDLNLKVRSFEGGEVGPAPGG
jgi:hypothetical protein